MKIAYIGHIFFCKKIGRKIEGRGHQITYLDYNNWGRRLFPSLNDIWEMDIIHFICAIGCRKYLYIFIIRYLLRKKIFVHFVGSDIIRLNRVNIFDRLNWIGALKTAHRVFVGAPWHVQELRKFLSVESFILFFNDYEKRKKTLALPDEFTVLTYLPEGKPEFYGESLIRDLIEKYPETKFIILGSDKYSHYSNVIIKTIDYTIDMDEIYSQSSLLIRLTKHDGFSSMVLEALSYGRNVIWTYDIPNVKHIKLDRNNLFDIFDEVKKYGYNLQGENWVKKNFNFSSFINNLEALYKNPKMKIDVVNY